MGETRRGEESQKGEAREAERAGEDLGRGGMRTLGEEAGDGGKGRGEAEEERPRWEANGQVRESEGGGIRPGRGLSPRQEARSGPARCPGGQMHSKEPSVLVQMPLWQRSSSLHSSTSAGQGVRKPGPPPPLPNIPVPTPPLLLGAPRPFTPSPTCLLPSLQAPAPNGFRTASFQSLSKYPDSAPFLSIPLPAHCLETPTSCPQSCWKIPAKNSFSPFRPFLPVPPFPALSPPFPEPGPAWVRTEARGSAGSGSVAGGTSTGKGAVSVEALAVREAEIALQALVHV